MAPKPTTPQAAPQVTVDPVAAPEVTVDAAAPPVTVDPAATPAPADAAAPETPAEDPPIVNGIIRLRDSNNQLRDFRLDQFGEAEGSAVRALLPPMWQAKIDAQKAFILNYRQTITDIPADLRAPGGWEKLFADLSRQGGHISDETSPAVRAFLDGPYCAEWRRSTLYKGYKTKEALGTFLNTAGSIVAATPEKYISALTLPVRGLIYAGGWVGDKVSAMPSVTEGQALALASAYQGAMYMATESEFAPEKTKTSAPGTVGTAGGYLVSGFNNVMVFAFAAWNMVSGYISGKPVEWKDAWKDAENYWTSGKGLKGAEETAQEIAVSKALEDVRPAVETLLRSKTIAGIDPNPYLDVKQGDFIAYGNGVIGTYQGPDAPVTPLPGPDGVTPLKTQSLEEKRLADLQGGLFSERTTTNIGASALGAGAAYGLTYKGIHQGYGNVNADGGFGKLSKQAEAAKKALDAAEQRVNDAMQGKREGLLRKPISLTEAVVARKTAFDTLTDLEDQVAKHSSAAVMKGRIDLQKLPADAGFFQKYVSHPLTVVGRPVGAGLAHTTNAARDMFDGIATGTAQTMAPNHAPRASGAAATKTAEIINDVAERTPTSWFGKAGAALGKVGTHLGIASAFVHPVINATNSTDTQGTVTYAGEGAAIAGATLWKSGGKLGIKALGVGAKKIVPGLNIGVSTVDVVEGYRTGDNQKFRDGSVSLATQGLGTTIGGAIGGLGFLAGPVGLASAPAGVAIGSSIGGWLSMATVPAAQYLWPTRQTTQAAPAAPAEAAPSTWGGLIPSASAQPARVAAVSVDARQPIANLALTQAEINAILESRMAVNRGGTQPQRLAPLNLGSISTRGAAVGN